MHLTDPQAFCLVVFLVCLVGVLATRKGNL
jgi:hypothetical protein